MRAFFFFTLVYFFSNTAYSQEVQNGNTFLNAELIFSHSNYEDGVLRFSAFPNFNYPLYVLIGRNKPYAIESGINIRNNGIIYKKDDITYKNRTISLGIPIKFFLPFKKPTVLLGAEFDYAFFLKTKVIDNGKKEVATDFLSDRVNAFQPAITAEVLLSKQLRLKANYYFTNFFNNSYSDSGAAANTYSGSSNIFYVSIVVGIVSVTAQPTTIRL